MERAPASEHARAVDAFEPEYEVVWPLGRRAGTESSIPAALPDLDGRTIAFLWDNLFRGDQMFDLVSAEFERRYPNTRFVHHEMFGNIHGADEIEVLEALPDRLREREVDAAIVAVAA